MSAYSIPEKRTTTVTVRREVAVVIKINQNKIHARLEKRLDLRRRKIVLYSEPIPLQRQS